MLSKSSDSPYSNFFPFKILPASNSIGVRVKESLLFQFKLGVDK